MTIRKFLANFSTVCLAAVCACIAHGQTVAWSYSLAEVGFSQDPGGGLYYGGSYGPSSYLAYYATAGTQWTSNYTYGGGYDALTGSFYATASGYASAGPQPGGSGTWFGNFSSFSVTIDNPTSHWSNLYVQALTYTQDYVYSASYNNIAWAVSVANVHDSTGSMGQISIVSLESVGLGDPNTIWGGFGVSGLNYDWENQSFGGAGSASGSANLGGSTPVSYQFNDSFMDDYTLYLAPDSSDTFYFTGGTQTEVYSTIPAPAALAPFAVGLLGTVRSRKRSRWLKPINGVEPWR